MFTAINNFSIWYIEDQFDPDYVDCLLSERKDNLEYYIDLSKDKRFPIDFSTIPKKETDGESKLDTIYRHEYCFYERRKSMVQPMWKLHHSTLERIMLVMQ